MTGWPKDAPPGTYSDPAISRYLRRTVDREANRAALPTTPKYPVSAESLFAQLREMGVSCGSCKGSMVPHTSAPCEDAESTFLCDEWEAK